MSVAPYGVGFWRAQGKRHKLRLDVPKYSKRSWQFYLGYAACLISDSGRINRLGKQHYKALLVAAYEVAFAWRLNTRQAADAFNFRWRAAEPEIASRRVEVQLYQLIKYASRPVVDASVNQLVESFLRGVPASRLPQLLQWASPSLARSSEHQPYGVYNAQLLVAIVCYRAPTLKARLPVITNQPNKQLSVSQASDLVLTVLGDLIVDNRKLICRISATAEEAALLTGYSVSAAGAIRQKKGVIRL